jgi:glycerophosphoryl diester phosphodiesterase
MSCSHLQIFSHKASIVGFQAGSIGAFEELFRREICSFDIDLFLTADGVLVVGHPTEIQQRLNLHISAENVNFDELFDQSGDALLMFDEVICIVAKGLHSCIRPVEHVVHLLVEPKGRAASIETIHAIRSAASVCGLEAQEIGVWVQDSSVARVAELVGMRALLPIKDSGSSPQDLGTISTWSGIGPSIKHSSLDQMSKLVKSSSSTKKLFFTWVVDDRNELLVAAKVSADGIISNDPVAMAGLVYGC